MHRSLSSTIFVDWWFSFANNNQTKYERTDSKVSRMSRTIISIQSRPLLENRRDETLGTGCWVLFASRNRELTAKPRGSLVVQTVLLCLSLSKTNNIKVNIKILKSIIKQSLVEQTGQHAAVHAQSKQGWSISRNADAYQQNSVSKLWKSQL